MTRRRPRYTLLDGSDTTWPSRAGKGTDDDNERRKEYEPGVYVSAFTVISIWVGGEVWEWGALRVWDVWMGTDLVHNCSFASSAGTYLIEEQVRAGVFGAPWSPAGHYYDALIEKIHKRSQFAC